MSEQEIMRNIEQCNDIEEEVLAGLCRRQNRHLYAVCHYDADGELVLMGLTMAPDLVTARRRAPLAEVTRCACQTVRFEDDAVHYLL